mmetsp:Transcript_22763/g.37699  ORF Transcript_22763/g.37699 Transcript_22763/m.37699 type:complete len:993 (-) Transcript_22763:437-3415(-)|eukprot:CAMPEP_0119310558 /NCGR_PEP_ID=MMETSP1333-20130426/19632_1 /TAXON_ID=418940 /ORGANISM="Scyphosphaera apsteinii, Strain RCC1455" /LENGTH=992 /DNA_ID=CAMNT_0007314761 /DNA_START=38 /DNA_END=3016 /DNA_ORIENTATION=-
MGMPRRKSAQEFLAAGAVAMIAFWAPQEDTGLVLRFTFALLALVALILASVGVDLMQEYRSSKETKKVNPFEIITTRVELPTSPPGGVYEAATKMSEHLQGFQTTLNSEIKATEHGFQVTDGNNRVRARVAFGTAIGWEQGGAGWEEQRNCWLSAVWASPRIAAVQASNWMGLCKMTPRAPEEVAAEKPAAEQAVDIGAVVRVEGVSSKPELNGKIGTVTKGVNESGRYGVRLDGAKDPLSLHGRNLLAVSGLDLLGVSIPCLRSFRAALSHLSAGMTLSQAISGLLLPLTGASRRSLARALHDFGAADEAGRPLTADATMFVIAADYESLDDLIACVEAHAAQQEKPEQVYVWLETFSLNYHAAPLTDRPMAWWQASFKAALKQIGSACVFMQPWEEPTPFTRAWCVWQMHCAITTEVPLTILVSTAEEERLQETLLEDMDLVTSAFDRKADGGWRKSAEADKPEQKAAIERAIDRAEGGNDAFAGKLISIFHRWLLARAKRALDTLAAEERSTSKLLDRVATLLQEHNDLESAEPLCKELVEGRKKKLGPRHADTLEAVNNLALLLHQLGKLEEAEPFSKEKLAGCRAQLGDHHPDTITSIDTLSQLLSDTGKLDEALPLKRESLAVKRKVLGDRHPDTLLSVNNLAVLLNDLGRTTGNSKMLREAEPLKREALAGCREVLGNRHPHTLASIANLADMLMQLGHIDPRALQEAEPLCREALAGSREVLGDGHPDTLKSVGNLAALLVDQAHQVPPDNPIAKKKLKEAEPLYREAVVGFTKGLGSVHPTTLSYVHEQARTLLDLGKVVDAERIQRDSVSSCRAQLGDSHPETLICVTHLAGLYRAQNKLKEAEPLSREVLDGWRKIEAGEAVQRNTLTSINILAELLHAQGKDHEAEPLCREVKTGFLAALGPQHPFTVSAAENLAGVLRSLGKTAEADSILAEYPQLKDRENQRAQGGPPLPPPPGEQLPPLATNGRGVKCAIEELSDED